MRCFNCCTELVHGKLGERVTAVAAVLAAVGVGAQSVADDAAGPLRLGVGALVVGRADDEAQAHALDIARNTSLSLVNLATKLASWSTTRASAKPTPDPADRRQMSRMITAASAVAVAVERVGTACTLPDRRSTGFWITSKPATVVGNPAIQSFHCAATAAAGDGARAGRRAPPWCAGTSGTSARTRRQGRPGPPRRRGAAPETPSCRGAPARAARRRRDAEAVSSTLSSAVKEATIHQKHPALWHACRVGDRRAVPIDEPAQRGRRAVTVLAHGPVRNWRRQRFQNVLGETDETDLRYYNERCQAQAIWSKGQTAWSC